MENKLIVSSSPHLKSDISTASVMRDVIIAMVPTLVASVILFGFRALVVTATCVLFCIVFEYLFNLITKREQTVGDFSAVVTGMLLAFNLPATLPLWMCVIGSFVSIVIAKQLFGGLGQNFANPALVGRIVLMISFATQMSTWAAPFFYRQPEIVTSATPLAVIPQVMRGELSAENLPKISDLLLGTTGGCLGETCAVTLILGGIYLVARRVISPAAPIAFIGTVFVFTALMGAYPLHQILSGGLLLGAIFMATDYTTTPVTFSGKIIFGIGCGLITCLIRLFGSFAEGVSFSIILMNILTPYIDQWTRSKPFGGVKAV